MTWWCELGPGGSGGCSGCRVSPCRHLEGEEEKEEEEEEGEEEGTHSSLVRTMWPLPGHGGTEPQICSLIGVVV